MRSIELYLRDIRTMRLLKQVGDGIKTMWAIGWLDNFIKVHGCLLSVGWGFGYMESLLWQSHGDRFDLHVQDYAFKTMLLMRILGSGAKIVLWNMITFICVRLIMQWQIRN